MEGQEGGRESLGSGDKTKKQLNTSIVSGMIKVV